jgi:hypothetical protein
MELVKDPLTLYEAALFGEGTLKKVGSFSSLSNVFNGF